MNDHTTSECFVGSQSGSLRPTVSSGREKRPRDEDDAEAEYEDESDSRSQFRSPKSNRGGASPAPSSASHTGYPLPLHRLAYAAYSRTHDACLCEAAAGSSPLDTGAGGTGAGGPHHTGEGRGAPDASSRPSGTGHFLHSWPDTYGIRVVRSTHAGVDGECGLCWLAKRRPVQLWSTLTRSRTVHEHCQCVHPDAYGAYRGWQDDNPHVVAELAGKVSDFNFPLTLLEWAPSFFGQECDLSFAHTQPTGRTQFRIDVGIACLINENLAVDPDYPNSASLKPVWAGGDRPSNFVINRMPLPSLNIIERSIATGLSHRQVIHSYSSLSCSLALGNTSLLLLPPPCCVPSSVTTCK
eukprot:GHVU01199040.1.p1 GENE.GHVU01199040.1~~GHVU01199040.1.p1  ORF type:complete len:353 (-),score=6.60 GHVU01199040.1:92-1150(-)